MMNKIFASAFIIFSLCQTTSILAEEAWGRVLNLKGEGFVSYKGETHEVKKGTIIYPQSEVFLEHTGVITLADNFDHLYHLKDAVSLKINARETELRSGQVWMQSKNKDDHFVIKTANASLDFTHGEFILSYDATHGKSQLMVINGLINFANRRSKELGVVVSEGNFSYVDNTYEEGAPRLPTPVGSKTYMALIKDFNGIQPMEARPEKIVYTPHTSHTSHTPKEEHASRHIASEEEAPKDLLLEEYKNSLLSPPKKIRSSHQKKAIIKKAVPKEMSKEVVHIYGQRNQRIPASMSLPEIVPSHDQKMDILKKEAPPIETEKLLNEIKNL